MWLCLVALSLEKRRLHVWWSIVQESIYNTTVLQYIHIYTYDLGIYA